MQVIFSPTPPINMKQLDTKKINKPNMWFKLDWKLVRLKTPQYHGFWVNDETKSSLIYEGFFLGVFWGRGKGVKSKTLWP
jgi:hypothetical protein